MQLHRKHIFLFLFVAVFSMSLPAQIMCWISPDLCTGISVQTSIAGILISVLLAAVTLAYYILMERQITVKPAFYWTHWVISLVGMIVFKYGLVLGISEMSISKLGLQAILYSLIIVQILFGLYFLSIVRRKK